MQKIIKIYFNRVKLLCEWLLFGYIYDIIKFAKNFSTERRECLVDHERTGFYMSELELAKLNSKLRIREVPEGPWLSNPFVCQVTYYCENKKTQIDIVVTVQGVAKRFYFSYSKSNGLEPDSALKSFFCPDQRNSLLEFLADFGHEKLNVPHHD